MYQKLFLLAKFLFQDLVYFSQLRTNSSLFNVPLRPMLSYSIVFTFLFATSALPLDCRK
uniref:Uncharacterized protein n=1 Tax=Lepeophtheirus salmonis TaxID=72036 RepID=A0A0K2TEU7_LEPSM